MSRSASPLARLLRRLDGRPAEILVPALVAYVPLLFTSPGRVGADTKSYLYIDPGDLLSGAASLWQPDTAMGTVTHQNIGYLWPMGPWFWVFDRLGVPDWFAQRLWLATVLFAAALGVRFLLRTLGWRDGGVLVASLAYMCSPYVLHYSARISVLLLPFAGLPWLIALTDRALRTRGWRDAALFGLVVATIGSVNATSLILVGLGPVLYLVHAAVVTRTAPLRSTVAAAARIGTTTVVCSLWWAAGLIAQAGFSLPVTRYTETYEVVANASSAPEVLRGLGYWFFYGTDEYGPWIQPSVEYTNRVWLLILSFALPAVALAVAAVVRWPHRTFFVLLIGVGGLVSVAGHPFDDPSPLGRIFSEFTRTDAGLALRSTPRAVPLVVLGTAVLLGAGVNALATVRPRWTRVAGVAAATLVVANLPAVWTLDMVEAELNFPEHLPSYWTEAASYLDDRGADTRVLELPGTDFTSYRWGNTIDPVLPGLMDRPSVARELVPFGSGPSAALLEALDRGLQEGTFEPAVLAPVARLMGVGDILYRADLAYERYRTPRPQLTWDLLRSTPGLDTPTEFGADQPPNVAPEERPLVDETTLGTPADLPYPPALASFPVDDPYGLARTVPAADPTIVDGDPQGLVDAIGAGVVDVAGSVLYGPSLLDDPELLESVTSGAFDLVLTDSHRRQAQRWGSIREVLGFTEVAGTEALEIDLSDNRLPVFGEVDDVPDAWRTVAEHRGVAAVTASGYGSTVTYTPEDRPVLALDGDPSTAWSVGAFGEPVGERIRVDLLEPVTAAEITLLQSQRPGANRFITEVELRFDDDDRVTVALDDTSRAGAGQVVRFDPRTFSRLEIRITATNVAPRPTYFGISPVGLAEIGLAGITVEEVIHLPAALSDALGEALADHPLSIVLTRWRADAREPVRTDPELGLVRGVALPVDLSVEVTGDARLSAAVADDVVDRLVGRVTATDGADLVARSTGSLPGDLHSVASSAFDSDPATAWQSRFNVGPGTAVEATRSSSAALSSVGLTFATGPTSSVPRQVSVLADGAVVATLAVPAPNPGAETVEVTATFAAVEASSLRIVVDGVEPRTTTDWYSGLPSAFPVSIVDVTAAGFTFADPADEVDTGCRDDLLSIDGAPVPVRITGTVADALDRRPLTLAGCAAVLVTEGDHVIRGSQGRRTGVDLDQLVLTSGPEAEPADPAARADVEVVHGGRTDMELRLPRPTEPTWLVLAQSHNDGWTAHLDGVGDLGEPVLVDGYANGWLLDPDRLAAADVADDGTVTVELVWTPQRTVDRAVVASLVGIVACLVVVWRGRRSPEPAAAPVTVARLRAGSPVARPALAAAGVGLVVFSVLNLPDAPLWAVLVAATAVVPLARRRDLAVPAAAAAALLGLTGAFHVLQQIRHRYPPDFLWPLQFERVHVIGVAALCCLWAEVVRSALAERRAGASGRETWAGDAPRRVRSRS